MLPMTDLFQHRGINPWMHHYLGHARSQSFNNCLEISFIYRFPCHNPCEMIRRAKATALCFPSSQQSQRCQSHTPDKLPYTAGLPNKKRCPWNAHCINMNSLRYVKYRAEYPRQNMHMLMTIHMGQGQTRTCHFFRLCRKFSPHVLHMHLPRQKALYKVNVIIIKDPILRYKRRDFIR